jgi:lipoprotein-anchoring transpeptidase ErfK/SrfK
MSNPTREGLDVVFLVKEQTPGWLRVQVSSRPNEMTAWVRSSDVRIRTVPNCIKVEVGARRATVFQGDTPLLTTTVAVGTSATPTPTGSFFVDGIVRLSGGGAYGAGQVSVAGFSDVLQEFGGGNGQIALHGTNAPGLLGQAVSNGCIRFADDMILQVMDLAPTGTPVEIVP